MPVIYAASGNCHVFVDATADLDSATDIVAQRESPAPRRVQRGRDAARARRYRADASCLGSPPRSRGAGVTLRGDERAVAALGARRRRRSRRPMSEDWDTEYLALTIAIGVVDSAEAAIEHINRHGSGHSEAIVTRDADRRARVRARRRRRLRVRERLDALHRRRRVRDGRGDRQLHPEAARAGADRPARAVHVQVSRRGRRARPRLTRGSPRSASSAGRSTRRTKATCAAPAGDRAARAGTGRADAGRRAPHKTAEDDPGAEHRLAMCRLAVAREPGVRGVRAGAARAGPSYTVDTLRALHAERPERRADVHPRGRHGPHAPWLARTARDPRARPPGGGRARWQRAPGDRETLAALGAARVEFLDMAPIDVSSSAMRARRRAASTARARGRRGLHRVTALRGRRRPRGALRRARADRRLTRRRRRYPRAYRCGASRGLSAVLSPTAARAGRPTSELVRAIAALAADKKAHDIVELDLRGVLGYTDYFMSARATPSARPRRSTTASCAGCKDERSLRRAASRGSARRAGS